MTENIGTENTSGQTFDFDWKSALVGLLVGIVIVLVFSHHHRSRNRPVNFETPYQAVLLDDNQVFYGKLSNFDSGQPVLTDVYYIKSGTDPQTKETKSVLLKRGKELHGPDRMYLNKQHIVLIEPVGPSSQVAKLIEQSKKE